MLHCDGVEGFDSQNCKAWIQDRMMIIMYHIQGKTPSVYTDIPMTKSPYSLFWFASWFMPSLQHTALSFAMKNIMPLMNPIKLIDPIIDSIVPSKYRWNTQEKKRMDEAIETYASQTNLLQQITESKMNLMILVISIQLLYFQYVGMTTMKNQKKQYTSLLARVDSNEDDIIVNSYKTSTDHVKRKIFDTYNKTTYYNNDESETYDINNWLNHNEYSIVRVICNTLVGLNSTLFRCLGGQSDDPTHEIVHWAKVLMYSQILAMLLNKHGLGPMTLATKLVLHELWTMKKKRPKKGKSFKPASDAA